MKPIHTDGGRSGVVKPIQRLHAEHEHISKVENDEQDDHREYAHQDGNAEVALTVVRRVK